MKPKRERCKEKFLLMLLHPGKHGVLLHKVVQQGSGVCVCASSAVVCLMDEDPLARYYTGYRPPPLPVHYKDDYREFPQE